MKPLRQVFGETILELAKTDDRIVISDAEFDGSAYLGPFKAAYPDRFFECGIAEQNQFMVAAGLSTCGLIPFAGTFSVFVSTRALDQIRNGICLSNFNVKILGSHAGLETGLDGGTHQGLEDIAIMRAIPNLTVISASTPEMMKGLMKEAIDIVGPVYLRIGREPSSELYAEGESFPVGGSKLVRQGKDITIIACGNMVKPAADAAELLEKQGVDARVVDMYSIKPIDREAIIKAAQETRGIVTVEDHSIYGGLGGAVAEVAAEECPCKVLRVGTTEFGRSGKVSDLMEHYGLTAENIARTAMKL